MKIKTQHEKVHIGAMIKQKVEESKMTTVEFSQAIHCSRPNVYNIYKSPSIDMERLMVISDVLNFDFINYYHLQSREQNNNNHPPKICIQVEFIDGKFNITHQEVE